MQKILLLFHTVRYLKAVQIYYRLYYFIRRRIRRISHHSYIYERVSHTEPLKLNASIKNDHSISRDGECSFLNLSHTFENGIDWNFSDYGKLWTYNLNYFEYLKEIEDIELIYDFIDTISEIRDGMEPFPISLRGMNWIKFLTQYQIREQKIDDSLYAQYYILMDNLEYHLLGNHLLENAFSLLYGAYYFQDVTLYTKAKTILQEELKEQILDDGAHFERSPMYHQIMLLRILDCINLLKNNPWQQQELLTQLQDNASVMLGWLQQISYQNGTIPLLNDSAEDIAPSSEALFLYAQKLHIESKVVPLKDSGYRKYMTKSYEAIIDIGKIGPDYIPGHAHADTFNFELQLTDQPFIVDAGLSTYETNKRRTIERGTAAHNTVEVMGTDSSEVWGGFRVARRASVIKTEEEGKQIKAMHDGYQQFGVLHTREWIFEEKHIMIKDTLNKPTPSIARIHFHPDVTEDEIRKRVILDSRFSILHYAYAPAFNRLVNALVMEIPFEKELKVEIQL